MSKQRPFGKVKCVTASSGHHVTASERHPLRLERTSSHQRLSPGRGAALSALDIEWSVNI